MFRGRSSVKGNSVKRKSISEISIMQLKARRERRRTRTTKFKNKTHESNPESKRNFAPIPMRVGLVDENRRQTKYVTALVTTLLIQTVAIMWNMFAFWNPNQPNVFHDNFQTKAAKWTISITCIIMTLLVIFIRLIDLKQLPAGSPLHRYYCFMALESFFLMLHVPPFKFGIFNAEDDSWNILGTGKSYLLLELCKIYNPL